MKHRQEMRDERFDLAVLDPFDPDRVWSGASGSLLPIASQDKNSALEICDGLIDILAVLFSVSGKHLRSPKRHNKKIARIRQLGMYLANVTLGLNMRFVGDGFMRDKSTVIHACRKIEDMRDDDEFDRIVVRVETIVGAAFRYEYARRIAETHKR